MKYNVGERIGWRCNDGTVEYHKIIGHENIGAPWNECNIAVAECGLPSGASLTVWIPVIPIDDKPNRDFRLPD